MRMLANSPENIAEPDRNPPRRVKLCQRYPRLGLLAVLAGSQLSHHSSSVALCEYWNEAEVSVENAAGVGWGARN